jgi:hypothetical protein
MPLLFFFPMIVWAGLMGVAHSTVEGTTRQPVKGKARH